MIEFPRIQLSEPAASDHFTFNIAELVKIGYAAVEMKFLHILGQHSNPVFHFEGDSNWVYEMPVMSVMPDKIFVHGSPAIDFTSNSLILGKHGLRPRESLNINTIQTEGGRVTFHGFEKIRINYLLAPEGIIQFSYCDQVEVDELRAEILHLENVFSLKHYSINYKRLYDNIYNQDEFAEYCIEKLKLAKYLKNEQS